MMERRIADGSRDYGILAVARLHRPYASMNWIRFNGSLRAIAVSQPLAGTPLVNGVIRDGNRRGVKMVSDARPRSDGEHGRSQRKTMRIPPVMLASGALCL
ncbi:hypothetical protein EMEDMD4_520003 [Sinorhizobium medicae]|uniref:Uncharacterized protein n=1 Tax=Sinorhizobium medicae TaxID=110321 RepID=A0A508X1U3_9HYPH|nr:hypothetical protein EMEDMD4_520003 [Sinorhizobium medicae]